MLSFFQSLWLHSLSRPSHEFDENKQLDHESTINFPFIDRLFLTAPGLNAFLVLPQHTARPFITIHKPIHRVVYCFSRHYLYIVKDIWEYQGTVENTRLRARVAGFHLHIYHMSRIPFLFLSFVDFVVFVSMILIFPSNQMKCAISSTNVAILLLLFKRTITWPNPLQIRHRTGKEWILFTLAFHPHNYAVISIILKSFPIKIPILWKIFSQPPLISFRS